MIAECRASGPIPPCNAMPVEVEAREGSRWGQNYSMETEQSGGHQERFGHDPAITRFKYVKAVSDKER